MASKFGQEVAQHQLAHSFMTFNTCYKDTGLFGIYAIAEDNKVSKIEHLRELIGASERAG